MKEPWNGRIFFKKRSHFIHLVKKKNVETGNRTRDSYTTGHLHIIIYWVTKCERWGGGVEEKEEGTCSSAATW